MGRAATAVDFDGSAGVEPVFVFSAALERDGAVHVSKGDAGRGDGLVVGNVPDFLAKQCAAQLAVAVGADFVVYVGLVHRVGVSVGVLFGVPGG